MTDKATHEGGTQLCSVVAQERGEDPIGTAPVYNEYLMIQIPSPWQKEVTDSKTMAPSIAEALAAHGNNRPGIRVQGILPQNPDEVGETLRIIHYRRPENDAFADFVRDEYDVPVSEAGRLVTALLGGPEDLAAFASYRLDADTHVRDLFICTHGSRDAACGRFGYPIFAALREQYVPASDGSLRVWRVSHLGGHRFAPTILDLPSGRYWAFMKVELLDTLIDHQGPAAQLREHYRGWCALEHPMAQVAEREAFMQMGWDWLKGRKQVRLRSYDEAAEKAVFELFYEAPDGGARQAWVATVEVAGTVQTLQNSGSDDWFDAKQYRVTRLDPLDPAEFGTSPGDGAAKA